MHSSAGDQVREQLVEPEWARRRPCCHHQQDRLVPEVRDHRLDQAQEGRISSVEVF
jgi:hypothetical protein